MNTMNWAVKPKPEELAARLNLGYYPTDNTYGFDPNELEDTQRAIMCALLENIDDLIGMDEL